MVGILVLGPKMNHQPYSDEDEQLILNVIHRLALKLENARLFSLEISARKELQKQNDIKTEFLHSAAHELKTPLTAIISSSEMLIEKLSLAGDDLEQQLAGNINSSALAMNRRVSELLDFARVQIGTLEMNKQSLDLNSMVHDVASKLSPLFLSRKQQLDLETQTIGAVCADKDKLEQVFINLLSNANKYSPNNSRIIIRTSQKNGVVQVEIQDSAPIIKDTDKGKLFTPYYRGEDVYLRTRTPGLGLGLAITKKIIEMHNGKIWIESKMGIGNIFAFSMDTLL
jgi:signal transduction histidine kinase